MPLPVVVVQGRPWFLCALMQPFFFFAPKEKIKPACLNGVVKAKFIGTLTRIWIVSFFCTHYTHQPRNRPQLKLPNVALADWLANIHLFLPVFILLCRTNYYNNNSNFNFISFSWHLSYLNATAPWKEQMNELMSRDRGSATTNSKLVGAFLINQWNKINGKKKWKRN